MHQDQYAVMGNPVEHSKSPMIHTHFAGLTNENMAYEKLYVELGGFEEAVKRFFDDGGKGLNITVPFKQEAWELASKHSEEAEMAGAVNTLLLNNEGELIGHNTDGVGLVRDITQNNHGVLANKSILLLGAGGASRGILAPLLKENPKHICIANRTVEKAQSLANDFLNYGGEKRSIVGCGFGDLPGQHFDWIINATSASLQGDLPPLPADILNSGAWCYDLMYSDKETVFSQWAKQAGAAKVMEGLGMLVEQAAESFYLWRGTRPETTELLR